MVVDPKIVSYSGSVCMCMWVGPYHKRKSQCREAFYNIFYTISVQENKKITAIADKDLQAMTDATLKDMDSDDDGYISWAEYKKRSDERLNEPRNKKQED